MIHHLTMPVVQVFVNVGIMCVFMSCFTVRKTVASLS